MFGVVYHRAVPAHPPHPREYARQDRLPSAKDMGELDITLVVFTTDNGAETITFPDGGITPFKGQKGEAWEGGYRAPQVVRWPGH